MGCGVWGVGCGVWGVGCGVWGVWGVGCGVWGVGCGVWGVGCGAGIAGSSEPPQAKCRSRSLLSSLKAQGFRGLHSSPNP